MTEIIHQTHNMAVKNAIIGGTKIISNSSFTKTAAVFTIAIANLIFSNIQNRQITDMTQIAKVTYDSISRDLAVS